MTLEKLRAPISLEAAALLREVSDVECAGNNTIAALIAGAIDASAAERLDIHLDACSACRQLVADLGRGLSALDDDRLPQPGDRLGRYTIERTLGVGGMGVVFEASDGTLERRVAIKVVRPDCDRHALLSEARAMARLAHPNIASIYDVGTVRGQLYLCMELVVGVTLREWLAVPRSARDIIAMFITAGRGLAYVHRCGLVHLDFKPDNVLVDRSGRAVVTDFGVAAMIGSARGIAAGTPKYMAPEHRAGSTDARADQFAFCTALDEALGARAPAWARVAIERGRRADRRERFASMDLLLAALAAGMARRGRRVKAIAALSIAVMMCVAVTRPPVVRFVERTIHAQQAEPREASRETTAPDVAVPAASSPEAQTIASSPATATQPARPIALRGTDDRILAVGSTDTVVAVVPSATSGAVAEHACDDGSELSCASERFDCPAGSTLAIADGCWSCVDERTCAAKGTPHVCDDGSPLRCTVARPSCAVGTVASIRGGCWQCADPFACTARSLLAPTRTIATVGTHQSSNGSASNGSGLGLGSATGLGTGSSDSTATCGNGFCEIGEDHASCPGDCCELTSGGECAPVCGNGFCEIAEDHTSCPADCCAINSNGSCS